MGKNEDCFNINYTGSGAEYRKDEGAKRPYDGPNGFGSQSKSHQYDEIVNQLFAKQFSMPANQWKLPEPETMLNCSRWEVIIASCSFSSVQLFLITQCVLKSIRPIHITYLIFIHSIYL